MNKQRIILIGAIALLGIAACSAPSSDPEINTDRDSEVAPEVAPEVEPEESPTSEPSSTSEPASTLDLPEGVSLSEDGQIIVMEQFSMLDVYCMDGSGQLAISYVGEGAFDHQVVACGQTFEPFDSAREDGFADVNLVTPVVDDKGLQLQDTEYTQVQCLSDHAGLEPAVSDEADGHMVLNCL
jgi:hypothetical protein